MIVVENEHFVTLGGPRHGKFVIAGSDRPNGSVHLALAAATREHVRRFHAAALIAGGNDNGAPGPRPQYSASYYGAFVFDPDGNNIEAVCRSTDE